MPEFLFLFLLLLAVVELRDGLIAFYEKHNDSLIKYAKAQLKAQNYINYESDAADVVHNMYEKVLKEKIIDFSRSEKEVKSYVFTVIRGAAYDLAKKQPKTVTLEDWHEIAYSGEEEIYRMLQHNEDVEKLRRILNKLDTVYKETLLLKVKDHKPREIAKIMGVPEQTVYTRLHRATAYIIKEYKGESVL